MLRATLIFVTGLVFGLGTSLAYRWYSDSAAPFFADGQPLVGQTKIAATAGGPARRTVVALGTLEPRDGIVQMGSPLVGSQVMRVAVQEGQAVKAGDVLVELDARAARAELALASSQQAEAGERQQSEIALAGERVASAELALAQLNDGRQLELDAQRSRLAVAGAKKDQAAKDVERLESLRKLPEPLASDQQIEQQRVVAEMSSAEREAAELALKRLEQSLLFRQQTAEAELRAARQSLALAQKGTGIESLKRQVELAELKVKQATVNAPSDGVVLAVLVHAGEIVAQQPLLQLANLDQLVCSTEVDASDVPYLRTGQKATIRCRAFHDSALDGTLDRVGNQVSAGTLRPLDPRRPVERDMTKVVVAVDSQKAGRLINSSGNAGRAALVGLQVEVSFPLTEQLH